MHFIVPTILSALLFCFYRFMNWDFTWYTGCVLFGFCLWRAYDTLDIPFKLIREVKHCTAEKAKALYTDIYYDKHIHDRVHTIIAAFLVYIFSLLLTNLLPFVVLLIPAAAFCIYFSSLDIVIWFESEYLDRIDELITEEEDT